jgi:FkbM family methyltransferase
VYVEPDVDSLNEYRSTLEQRGLRNAIFYPVAAWSEKTALTVYISDSHPASSFTEGTKEYQGDRLRQFRPVAIEADTLDNILADVGLTVIDLVSITTNGAEQEILKGMKRIMEAGLPFISLARTADDHIEVMGRLGYDLYSHDDRGFTFERRA